MLAKRIALATGLVVALVGACVGCTAAAPSPFATVSLAAAVPGADSVGAMMDADALRTGWYPNQPLLDPAAVGGPSFGPLFDTIVDGQIYAQPLYTDGLLLVPTESNQIYGLDPVSGAVIWNRQLAPPWRPADFNCGDLTPSIGITGTPAIDVDSRTAYLLSKTYANGQSGPAAWFAHAIDLATGSERPGFPVAIAGTASNDPTRAFDPTRQMQRPGLLLMNDVIYAAFGAHCDVRPYAGWIAGIDTRGFVKTLWTTEVGGPAVSGAGIWQSGGGLVSDGDGQILFATGNDWSTPAAPIRGRQPPGALGESVVRVAVQGDGSLAAVDFFAPAERARLNLDDDDLGSGAPVALPVPFGEERSRHLLVQSGKSGYVYLLDRDDLGGYAEGAGSGDRVLQRLGPNGGVWSKPSVWPGDGGYLYLPSTNGCPGPGGLTGCLRAYQYGTASDMAPAFSLIATSSDPFGYGSSAVVVTSDGLRSGSALLWTVWSSGWNGTAGQLRAYDAVPDNGTFRLRFLAGIGQSAKYTSPGIGAGRVYVGTRDGHVLGFGLTGTPAPRAEGLAFPPTLVGARHASEVRLTVPQGLNVQGLAAAGAFSVVATAVALPVTIAAGGILVVPITFAPTAEGPSAGTLTVLTDHGNFSLPLTGVGQVPAPRLTVTPGVLKFAPALVGSVVTQTVSISNAGTRAVPLTAMSLPQAPFSISGLLPRGQTLGPGASIKVVVTFAPTSAPGSWSGSFSVAADKALAAVALEGSGMVGGLLRLTPATIDLGPSYVGDRLLISFRLSNAGDAPVTIADSRPPASLSFQAQTHLDVGTVISPGASVLQTISISAVEVGLNEDTWRISGDDRQGPQVLSLKVNGFARPPPAPVDALNASPPISEPGGTPSGGAVPAAHASAAPGCTVAATFPGAEGARVTWVLVVLALAVRRRRADSA